jgi:hypothetical protein
MINTLQKPDRNHMQKPDKLQIRFAIQRSEIKQLFGLQSAPVSEGIHATGP